MGKQFRHGKLLLTAFIVLAAVLVVSACSNKGTGSGSENFLKVGTTDIQADLWNFIRDEAKGEGLNIEVVTLTGQVDLNQSLADGDLDANAFQHIAYLTSWNGIHKASLVAADTTIIAPLGIYSKKIQDIKDISQGAKIAIPNDQTNLVRALKLLESANLIKLKDGFDSAKGGVDQIADNPHKLDILTAQSGMLPRVLEDVEAAIINNGVALQAGYKLNSSLYHENEADTAYINVVATKDTILKDKAEAFKKLNKVLHSQKVSDYIQQRYEGNFIPVTRTVEDVVETFKKENGTP
ncbi:MetQ/NlpA family ABC transporter substrate-binding protein [Paenibacillus sp. GCM10012307]|uniref:Lipoprotein n=1 Tax=Paenibacillus roseus TaxID=2798579 RepID=A0A934J278_9BACL|nr:MetQ/NlpA family ABC transporter substrate-binding protein [Paenibacillus roseus]MBJ6360214.1 MetQ/NlpA family ABC transporter substrate-binding protein [Paenibacillus roseus]